MDYPVNCASLSVDPDQMPQNGLEYFATPPTVFRHINI